jgi:hypothetical protein
VALEAVEKDWKFLVEYQERNGSLEERVHLRRQDRYEGGLVYEGSDEGDEREAAETVVSRGTALYL